MNNKSCLCFSKRKAIGATFLFYFFFLYLYDELFECVTATAYYHRSHRVRASLTVLLSFLSLSLSLSLPLFCF
jgi:hypothetical protein